MNVKRYLSALVFIMFLCYLLPRGSIIFPQSQHDLYRVSLPYELDLANWEFKNAPPKWESYLRPVTGYTVSPTDQEVVIQYYSMRARSAELERELGSLGTSSDGEVLRANEIEADLQRLTTAGKNLEPAVEGAIERELTATIYDEGIRPPWVPIDTVFPPVSMKLETLPMILVVSPRDRIEIDYSTVLKPGLDNRTIEDIEEKIRAKGYAAIVEPLGGYGTYPTMVPLNSSLDFTINVSAHEWIHNYLIFTPLGQSYGRSDEMRTMNETVANIVGNELGNKLKDKFYRIDPENATQVSSGAERPNYDFPMEMRRIRLEVDRLLLDGKVDQAEVFMERERLALAKKGYYLRHLNQAYFAFHQDYADSPLTTNRVGQSLLELRAQCSSLADFLVTVSKFSSLQDLDRELAVTSSK